MADFKSKLHIFLVYDSTIECYAGLEALCLPVVA
jgi:hypothetical protein